MSSKTYVGAKFYIGDAPLNEDSDNDPATGYPSLAYTQVPNMGNHDATGVTQNAVRYPTWDKPMSIAGKGAAEGTSPSVEFLDEVSAGMTAMKAASAVTDANNYPFKIERADGIEEYYRGLVMSPQYPKGNNEAFARIAFSIAVNQDSVFVDTNP